MAKKFNKREAQYIRCPKCDKLLLKCGAKSTVETYCPTCKKVVVICFRDGELVVFNDRRINRKKNEICEG